jgi:hypothetical protein
MVLFHGEALSNAEATRRLYRWTEFPGPQVPSALYLCECCPAFKGLWYFESYQPRSRPLKMSPFWTWSLKSCKPLRKNRMLLADELHYEWTFPASQFGERCTNRDYILIISTLKTRNSTTSNYILSMASSENRRRIEFFKHRLNFTRDEVFNSHNKPTPNLRT